MQAVATLVHEGICKPVLLGNEVLIREQIKALRLNLGDIEIIDPLTALDKDQKAIKYCAMRNRKGITMEEAKHRFRSRAYYAAMMLKEGEVDVCLRVSRALSQCHTSYFRSRRREASDACYGYVYDCFQRQRKISC